jgi:hypothetical protein
MCGSYNEELVLVEYRREKVVLGCELAPEFLDREDIGVDGPSDSKLRFI